MYCLVNKKHTSCIEDYMDYYVTKKPGDCILYSEDGTEFKVHKELLGQTEFMFKILKGVKEQCCSMVKTVLFSAHLVLLTLT